VWLPVRAFLQSLSAQFGALVAAEAVALVAQTSAIAIAYLVLPAGDADRFPRYRRSPAPAR